MIGLDDFKANAEKEGICEEYRSLWDRCISKKDIMDMALGVKAVDYLCNAIAKGWGMSPSAIRERFDKYINGHYVKDNGKYTSQMFCKFNGLLECNTTLLVLLECNISVIIPENHICEIYACGKSKIDISGQGQALVITYGNPDDIVLTTDMDVRCKRLRKKDRDRY